MDDRSPRAPCAVTSSSARIPPPRADGTADPAMFGIIMEAVVLAAGEIEPRSDPPPLPGRSGSAHRFAKGVLDVTTSDDFKEPAGVEAGVYTGPVDEPAEGRADVSREAPDPLAEDRDRFVFDINNTLIHQMFAVSLDLHAALSRIEYDDDRHAVEKIRKAIDGLDQAINDLRNAIIGRGNHRAPKRP